MGGKRTVIGFVTEDCGDGVFYAWSSSIRGDIKVDCNRFRQNVNILAKWVELELDEMSNVCEPAVIIRDRYDSRTYGRDAELLLDIRHDGCYRNKMEMFRHPELGLISDPDHVVRNVHQNAIYRVWINSNRIDSETGAKWVVSTRNEEAQPSFQRSGTQSLSYSQPQNENRRVGDGSPGNYNYPRRRSRSSERSYRGDPSYENYNRRSPDNYGYHPGPPSMYDNRRSRSPSINSHCPDDRSLNRSGMSERDNNSLYRDGSPINHSQARTTPGSPNLPTYNKFSETRRPIKSNVDNRIQEQHRSNSRRPSSLFNGPPGRVSPETLQAQNGKPTEYIQTQNQPRRDHSPNNCSRAETTSEEESEDEREQLRRPDVQSKNPVQNNEPVVIAPKTQDGDRNQRAVIRSNITESVNPENVSGNANRAGSAFKRPQTPEEKEMHKLRSRVNQMKELIKNLTRNEDVALAMQLANLEEYEELIEIVGQKS